MAHDLEWFVPQTTPWDAEARLKDSMESEFREEHGYKVSEGLYGEQHKLTVRKHGFHVYDAGVAATSSGDARFWADFTWKSYRPKVDALVRAIGAHELAAEPEPAARTKRKGPTEETLSLIVSMASVRAAHPSWGRQAIADFLGIDSVEKLRHADRVSGRRRKGV